MIARFLSASCLLLVAAVARAQVPPGSAGTVTLPLTEYGTLLDRAARPPVVPPAAPFPSMVNRADLTLRVGTDTLRGTIAVQGEVWREGAAKVALLRGGTLIDATLAGAAVPLVTDAGTTAAIVRGPATFSIALTWAAELTSEPGRAVAMLPAVHAGSVHATIELSGDNPDVRVEPGIIGSRSVAGGKTTVGVTLEPGTASRLSWSSRDSAAKPTREVRLVSDAKTLVTIGENDLRVGTLFEVTVTQGEPAVFRVLIPDGFDVAAVSGASVESEGMRDGRLQLAVREPSRERHQFLVALEKTVSAGVAREELTLPAIDGVQRETGEIALEALGTVELNAIEKGELRRLDVSEVSGSLVSLARTPLLSAFRYQRRAAERVPIAFDVKRFADAPVLSAVADEADVTTLVTVTGQTLTEVRLTLRNRGQLFLKVGLPAGASLLSAEVAGESVKPVEGSDGSRVPLVRPGFQPSGAYNVSFVYVAAGTALGKKGDVSLSLAKMDVPVTVLQWELFVPDRYEVKRFDGDAIPQHLVGAVHFMGEARSGARPQGEETPEVPSAIARRFDNLVRSDVGGFVVDAVGAVLPGVRVTVTQGRWSRTAISDSSGAFVVSGVPDGPLTVSGELAGFKSVRYQLQSGGGPPIRMTLQIAAVAEAVTVSENPERVEREQKPKEALPSQAASQNVLNLQRRVSGVLPVRIDVPHAGRSYVLLRPLVLDEPTTVRFEYKTR